MKSFLSSILIISVLCTVLQGISAEIKRQTSQSQLDYKSIQNIKNRAHSEEKSSRDSTLKKENSDYYGWLEVTGTRINYPVMYSPDAIDFYLNHNFEGKPSSHGLPFVSSDFKIGSKHLIVYAHNMPDGTLFSDLLKFADPSFFNNHSRLLLSRGDILEEFTVLASVFTQLESSGETLDFYTYIPIDNNLELFYYLEQVEKYATLSRKLNCETKAIKEVITLSTCSYHVEEGGRFCVIAARI